MESNAKTYSDYKYSGERWIGDIPLHWEITRLASLLNNISIKNRSDLPLLSITREMGVIIRDTENDEDNHNYIPDDLSNYKILPKGYFGMNKMKAWQGSYGISEHDGIVSPAYFVFKISNNINTRFFHLAIRSKLYIEYFGSASDGVRIGQWDLSKSRMKNIPFLLPPLEEQTAIASFLDRKTALIDQAIEIKQKQIELLKERKQILIQNAVTRGLNPNVKMKDSGVEWIGEIPEHWEVVSSKTLFSERKQKAKEYDLQLTSSQKFGVIPQREYMEIEGRRVTQVEFNHQIQKHVEKGDFIISMRSFQGGIEYSEYSGCISSAYVSLIPSSEVVSSYFKYLLKCERYIEALQSTSNLVRDGQALRYDNFKQVALMKIPQNEQSNISSFIDQILKNIESASTIIEMEVEKLKEYKSTLINCAVTGKIKVS